MPCSAFFGVTDIESKTMYNHDYTLFNYTMAMQSYDLGLFLNCAVVTMDCVLTAEVRRTFSAAGSHFK